MQWEKRGWLIWLSLLLIGCTPVAVGESVTATPLLPTLAVRAEVPPTGTAEAQLIANNLPATNTPLPSATPPPVAAPVTPRPSPTIAMLPTSPPPTPGASGAPPITPTYSPDDPDYLGRTIDELTLATYGSGVFTITRTIENAGPYMRYEFAYDSGEELVKGFMNVPHEGDQLPVALVLHGYVNPADYKLFAYTSTYADALAKEGYMVFHPNYRHHPAGKTEPPYNTFRVDYAVDVLNLVALIRSGSQDPAGPLRRADEENVHMMGHSMGGGIAQRVMTVRPDWFKAVVLYGSMSGDERRNYEKIREWAGERSWGKEVFAPEALIAAVSPINYIERWTAPVAIHHGEGDDLVPPQWSRELCANLTARRYPVECYEYYNYPHTFYGAADDLFIERMIRFFKQH